MITAATAPTNPCIEILGQTFSNGVVTVEKKLTENLTQQDILNRKMQITNQKVQAQAQIQQINSFIVQMDADIETCNQQLALFDALTT